MLKLIRPVKNRKIFHLLNDEDAFIGQQGGVLLFVNDTERLIIKITTLKLVIKEGLFLHLISQKIHWVIVFNNNCDELFFHPALAAKIEPSDNYLQKYDNNTF